MIEELQSIKENKTWSLVTLPKGHRPIGLKWIYKLKHDEKGDIIKHKARLVAKGYVQRHGVDFDEVFAPVARMESVRVILIVAAQLNWSVHHMDVKSAFLNRDLKEEVYVCQPPSFVRKGEEQKVLRLHKALYGLTQAPRAWNSKLDTIIMGESSSELIAFKTEMNKVFKMTDLGTLSYYLGIEVHQGDKGISLSQTSYVKKLLEKVELRQCNPCSTPMEAKLKLSKDSDSSRVDLSEYRSLIGSLRFLLHTRPKLNFSVSYLSRFMEAPSQDHLAAVKHLLRYVAGTMELGLFYPRGTHKNVVITGYSDSDLGGDLDDGRSTSGTIFFIGDCPTTWSSQKQHVVALSSCEAEYIAGSEAACQAVLLAQLIEEMLGKFVKAPVIKMDNLSAISLSKNPVFHKRSKHIKLKYHFIREC
jgi:hypothetical protein